MQAIPDEGATLVAGACRLELVPAHFLHSVGNFTLFDAAAGYLFTGDIGASVFPPGARRVFIDDLAEGLPFMEGFHRRYMANNAACRLWVDRVRALGDVKAILPQHGAMLRGPAVGQFLDWLETLRCGVDLLASSR